ncbi:MAG: sugar transferase [Bacteroidota bacterium]
MSVSTLPNFFTKEKRLLFVKEKWAEDEISLMRLPNSFQSVSLLSLNEMVRNFDHRSVLPNAILVNLDSVSLTRVSPILKRLKSHDLLKQVPIIGLKCDYSTIQKNKYLQIGFSDCYCQPLDWSSIELRVRFLNKYQEELEKNEADVFWDKPYQMPIGKRIFDVLVASFLLLLLSPLFLILAILIKVESKGNVFYYSKRVGTGYQVFDFIKFRSMQNGADKKLGLLVNANSYGSPETASTFFKMRDDPRVTLVGKFIRKTSIDELPQLINVLRGEMSIVGNRPLPLYEAQKLTCDDWSKRFMAPAGLTGLWQVDKRGKDNLPAEERIRLDMSYADSYSFLMDLKIMLRTLPAMLQRE